MNLKLIVGLGNPGEKYAQTRHNVGFDVVDALIQRHQLTKIEQKFRADYTVWHTQSERIYLVKPYTYMNLSGEAVLPLMSYFGVGMDDIVVVYDDMDISPGKIRLRQSGSAGGHNGMKSIINMLGSNQFNRIRVGIGRPHDGWKVVDHVLAPFTPDERLSIDQGIDQAVEALENWVEVGDFLKTMNEFNRKS